jgi:hypothetical protein
MRRRLIRLASAAAVLVAAASAMAADAETCSLQIKRLEAASARTTGPPTDTMFRGVYPQRFFRQTGLEIAGRPEANDEEEFAKVITKEPASYNSKSPFRAVAKLGTQQFGFVIDSRKADELAAEPAKEAAKGSAAAKTPRPVPALPDYGRLLFDVNHNGDLTDDPVIEAQAAAGRGFPTGDLSFSFPRVDLTVDADGTKIDYAFTVSGYGHSQVLNEKQTYQYVSVSLNAAAYREGEITLDGKKTRIVVTDYNSNGRFDDVWAIDDSVMISDGTVYPRQGDVLFVDPQAAASGAAYGYDPTTSDVQQFLAKAVQIGGRFYDLQITPAGDKLTVEPSKLEVGHVSNPQGGYRGLVYGDLGVLKITADAEGRAALPVGSWKLLSYTIDRTGDAQPEGQTGAAPSLLQTLANAVLSSAQPTRPRTTMVSARMVGDQAAFEVRSGETTQLRFGPPYTPKVTASYLRGDRLSLGLSLVGVGGEACSNLVVNGARPPKPAFTITDPEGKVVVSGNFEYG